MDIGGAKRICESFATLGDRGHKLLLAVAEHFTERTPVASVPVAAAWAKRVKPKSGLCYMNASKFVIDHPDAKYYEGYWSAHFMPVWHAWVVLDGKVIDFTAEACERKLKRRDSAFVPPESEDYFGVHIPTSFIISECVRTKVWADRLTSYFAAHPPAVAAATLETT